ncbi:hypothetical protein PG988_015116 [Apiospora saccharicola]
MLKRGARLSRPLHSWLIATRDALLVEANPTATVWGRRHAFGGRLMDIRHVLAIPQSDLGAAAAAHRVVLGPDAATLECQ